MTSLLEDGQLLASEVDAPGGHLGVHVPAHYRSYGPEYDEFLRPIHQLAVCISQIVFRTCHMHHRLSDLMEDFNPFQKLREAWGPLEAAVADLTGGAGACRSQPRCLWSRLSSHIVLSISPLGS